MYLYNSGNWYTLTYSHPSYTSHQSDFYKISVDGTGHVNGATAVKKEDITALGIPGQDTTYSVVSTSADGLAPKIDGSTTKFLRGDGTWAVPPAQTTVSGNAGSATKWETSRNINGMSVNGEANRFNYGTCSTAAATAAKTVACTGFSLATGSEITVKFTVTNTASNPTLNVNSTGAKAIYYRGSAINKSYLAANRTYTFRYNGTQYDLVGDVDTLRTVDTALSTTSTNPVQNKIVKAAIDKLGSVDIDLSGATYGTANPINADTLGGYDADVFINTDKIINNFTTTEEGFVADARALKALNDSKLSMKLLWLNDSPESSFAANTIGFSENLHDGDIVTIHYGYYSSGDSETFLYKGQNITTYLKDSSAMAIRIRMATIRVDGISFENCNRYAYSNAAATTSNGDVIPYAVTVLRGGVSNG